MDYSENFEQWCLDCVRITDKLTGASVPFRLNAPQRRVAAIMESRRRAGLPIRLILLKARQWGGSTLTQIYMAWMQLVRHKGWNSLICSHVRDASANIRGMYSHLLRNYPEDQRGPEADPRRWVFSPFERSSNIGCIPARDCRVTVTSSHAPDAVRGGSYQMAHLSEVAFWADGDTDAAERIVRTVGGSVPLQPDTVVVMESTADGTGNFFHREWKRAVRGESDKTPVFVPWHEIEIYSMSLTEEERQSWPAKFDDYELCLLHHKGLPVEKVAWYHCKRREYATHEQMMAEYPTTPDEAFAHSASPWLSPAESEKLRVAESPQTAVSTRLALLLAPELREAPWLLALASRDADGRVTLLSVEKLGGDMSGAINSLRAMSADGNTLCGVARTPSSQVSSHRLARHIADAGLSLAPCLDEGADTPGKPVTLTAPLVAELRDSWHGLLVSGRWLETDENACKELRSLKADGGDTAPEALLRLAIAGTFASTEPAPPLRPADFL